MGRAWRQGEVLEKGKKGAGCEGEIREKNEGGGERVGKGERWTGEDSTVQRPRAGGVSHTWPPASAEGPTERFLQESRPMGRTFS